MAASELSQETIVSLTKKIYLSKIRLLSSFGFFGTLLLGIKFALSNDERLLDSGASTNGKTIYFHPTVLSMYKDEELDFVIMHELMHIALKHPSRISGRDDEQYNAACDIVVNSNIMEALGLKEFKVLDYEVPHLTPFDEEGSKYSVEEVYSMLPLSMSGKNGKNNKSNNDSSSSSSNGESSDSEHKPGSAGLDSHIKWGEEPLDVFEEDLLNEKILHASEIAALKKQAGTIPGNIIRMIKELKEPLIDWRVYLNNFIQENIVDYSFFPPDKRYSETDFFLPDFNDPEDEVKNILFMVDVSGSMSPEDITECYSEINGAIEQFNGKLQGYLGFFDTRVTSVTEFSNDINIKSILPKGGGGTNIMSVFNYIKEEMSDNPPTSLIIMTDGYVEKWPSKEKTMNIPLLWVINNKEVTPPIGKIARLLKEKNKHGER